MRRIIEMNEMKMRELTEEMLKEMTTVRISMNTPCGSNDNHWSTWYDLDVPDTLLYEFRNRCMESIMEIAKEYREELEAEMLEKILWGDDE